MEELFKKYVEESHPEIVSTQIFAASTTEIPRTDTYGYIAILYGNGARIVTNNHYKDSTKYLEAFMRLESMTGKMIDDVLNPYDVFEKEWFEANK